MGETCTFKLSRLDRSLATLTLLKIEYDEQEPLTAEIRIRSELVCYFDGYRKYASCQEHNAVPRRYWLLEKWGSWCFAPEVFLTWRSALDAGGVVNIYRGWSSNFYPRKRRGMGRQRSGWKTISVLKLLRL